MRGTEAVTFKQTLFVMFYLGGAAGNATEAARRAGYRKPSEQGHENLRKPQIQAAIDAKIDALKVSQDEILLRMARLATGDIGEYLIVEGPTWRVDLEKVKRHGYAIKKIRQTKDGPEIELESKFNALVKLGEYYNMWNREAPPAISLAELARKLKEAGEQYDRDGGVGRDGGRAGALPE
jgi:hypothetical protein